MARASSRLTLRDHPFVADETLHALGLAADDVLDLTSSRNPYGPPPRLLELAREASLVRYPDATASAARARIAERFGTTPECVAIGSGAAELLWSIARAAIAPESTVLAIEPSYPEFSLAAQQLGARIVRWRSVERTGHAVDLEQIAELIALERPQVVSLCAPGSPTGSSVRFDRLQPLAAAFPEIQFVVDQTFLSLSDDHADASCLPLPNLLLVRSLGKELGLPGVRVGYLLAAPALCQRLEAGRPAFSTSAITQRIAAAAMDETPFIDASREALRADRARLIGVLDQLGLAHTPSVAPFCLVRMARATEVRDELLREHRIAVVDATAFGLPDHLRIGAVSEAAAPQLMAALAACSARRRLRAGRET